MTQSGTQGTPTWTPSARQAGCAGLKRQFYPAFVRDLVDYDYEEKLPAEARVWLAAFSEEHYRGWRMKGEQQVHPLSGLRAAGAEHQRRRRNPDMARFGDRVQVEQRAADGSVRRQRGELLVAAAAAGVGADELSGRNLVEDAVVAGIDRRRVVEQAVKRAAAGASWPGLALRCREAAAGARGAPLAIAGPPAAVRRPEQLLLLPSAPGAVVARPARRAGRAGAGAGEQRRAARLLEEVLALPAALRRYVAGRLMQMSGRR